ncbi:hypothetical protein [Neobacillus mesonae]|uniref:hypothetical protein n=1 Tax=Neobacillus mesonae TaxID=1193713 RepID=UPI002572218C|nr:hypothetical protein [Neobacillus mesonae]
MDKNKTKSKGNMDSPEQYATEKESLFDKFKSEQTVDPIPVEDLNEEKHEEKAKHNSKTTSSSEKKYRTGM